MFGLNELHIQDCAMHTLSGKCFFCFHVRAIVAYSTYNPRLLYTKLMQYVFNPRDIVLRVATKFGLCQIRPAKFGPCQIRPMPNSAHAKFGLCQIRPMPNSAYPSVGPISGGSNHRHTCIVHYATRTSGKHVKKGSYSTL